MRYTLKSRFRGTIAGAMLALLIQDNVSSDIVQACNQTISTSKSLITQGKFSVDDLFKTNLVESNASNQQAFLNTLFSTLPVALFFHDNFLKLRQNLLQVAGAYSDNLIIRDSVLAVGYAIAQSLNEKLYPSSLLTDVVKFIGDTPTNLPQQLQTLNNLLLQRASLEQAYTELYKVNTLSNIVATAFYTFLKSLEDFRLSVTLSLNSSASSFTNHDYYITSAMTGALSGAYNSTLGIPISWQIKYLRSFSTKTAENNFLQMLRLTDELLAVWSGVYEPDNQEAEFSEGKSLCNYLPLLKDNSDLCVYAAPRIIRLA